MGDKQMVDERMLILGSSKISNEDYNKLAVKMGNEFPEGDHASNPLDTFNFVQSVKDNPNKEQLIYKRAMKCIDDAEFVVVDLSQASTGMGLEVGYLLTHLKQSRKQVLFIAKEGTKPSPHIIGMYKAVMGNYPTVSYYKEQDNMFEAVEKSKEFSEYKKIRALERNS